MLHVNDASIRLGGRLLLDRATVAVPDGHRVALVGRNGAGKSTLLRAILGEVPLEGGAISIRRRARVAAVAQSAPAGATPLIDFVLAADRERSALLAEAETARDAGRIAEIHERLGDIAAHSAPARAAAILAGLGFDEAAQSGSLDDYSGGWRMRVALAATLFSAPDLLLLDEPSNHLDLEARLWLEGYLAGYAGTVVLVSHDRALINAVAGAVIHLSGGKLTLYRGDYDTFARERAQRRALEAAQIAKQLAQRRRIEAFVDRFRAQASKARQAQSRLKALERMPPLPAALPDEEVAFELPDPEPLSPPLIALDGVAAGYDGARAVLSDLDLRVDMDDRIALLGANGNGKTTLLRLLAGELRPLAGQLRRSSKLRVGYFAQEQSEVLDPRHSAVEALAELMPDAPQHKLRAHLGRFGLGQGRGDVRVAELSGGERAKLVLARITRDAPHVLLLDEPTNHLDIDSRQALIAALNVYDGAVLLVTHDPQLVELCCDRLWLVADGGCRPFEGDLSDYRRGLLQTRRGSPSRAPTDPRRSRRHARRAGAAARAALAPLRAAATRAEARMEQLASERDALRARLADPAAYDGPAAAVTGLQRELHAAEQALSQAEATWLAAQEAYEAARGTEPGE